MTKEAYGTFILSPHPFCLAEWGTNATEEPIYRLIISIREHNRLRHNHVVREQKPWEHKKQLDRDSILICTDVFRDGVKLALILLILAFHAIPLLWLHTQHRRSPSGSYPSILPCLRYPRNSYIFGDPMTSSIYNLEDWTNGKEQLYLFWPLTDCYAFAADMAYHHILVHCYSFPTFAPAFKFCLSCWYFYSEDGLYLSLVQTIRFCRWDAIFLDSLRFISPSPWLLVK